MNAARSFEDLIVWQRAHQFVLNLYKATKSFPKNELFGLTAQMRRAAISSRKHRGRIQETGRQKLLF